MSDLKERAAIVAWLRGTAEMHSNGHTSAHHHHADACTWSADAIERGEHLVSTPTCRICGHKTDSKIHEWCERKDNV